MVDTCPMPRNLPSLCLGVVLLLVVSSCSNALPMPTQKNLDTLEELYQHAMRCRNEWNPDKKMKEQCVDELLVTASGIRGIDPSAPFGREWDWEKTSDLGYGTPVPNYPSLEFTPFEHRGAIRELAKVLMEGWGIAPDAQLALELFKRAAQLGDPEAQAQMAVRYSYGLQYHTSWDQEGIVHFGEPDEDEALLHWYWAAVGGDMTARMVMGYSHYFGLSVPKSCFTAAMYYLPVAEEVADLASNFTGPGLPQIERIRLSMHHLQGSKAERQKEVVQYYQDSADKGNVDAQTAVGQVLNYGTHGVERDHQAAMSYLQRASDAGDVQATAHLANMIANGLDLDIPRKFRDREPIDYATAHKLFEVAARNKNSAGLYGLGYLYLVGQGVAQDYDEAFRLLTMAADQGHADAHFFLGMMHLKGLGSRHKSIQRAYQYFTAAAHAGHVQAAYNAALLHLGGKGTVKNCKPAVSLLKSSCEKGPVGALLQRGHEAFFKGHYQASLWEYLQAAAAGMELGMSNSAWLLEQGYVRAGGEVRNVTFQLYRRSAAQGNVASLLAMGDSYFYGRGVHQDWAKASAIYYEAYQERSPEAMFNLGFVHEFGAGVPKDLALARRFYDMALHTTRDAALAVYCARAWLVLHRAWDLLRPHLPSRWDPVLAHVFSLTPPHTSVLGSWTALAASLLPGQAMLRMELNAWQALDAAGLTSVLGALSSGSKSDVGETLVMLCLTALLFVVLRLRRQRLVLHQGAGRGQEAGGEAVGEGGVDFEEHQQQHPQQPAGGGAFGSPVSGHGHTDMGDGSGEVTPQGRAAGSSSSSAAPAHANGEGQGGGSSGVHE